MDKGTNTSISNTIVEEYLRGKKLFPCRGNSFMIVTGRNVIYRFFPDSQYMERMVINVPGLDISKEGSIVNMIPNIRKTIVYALLGSGKLIGIQLVKRSLLKDFIVGDSVGLVKDIGVIRNRLERYFVCLMKRDSSIRIYKGDDFDTYQLFSNHSFKRLIQIGDRYLFTQSDKDLIHEIRLDKSNLLASPERRDRDKTIRFKIRNPVSFCPQITDDFIGIPQILGERTRFTLLDASLTRSPMCVESYPFGLLISEERTITSLPLSKLNEKFCSINAKCQTMKKGDFFVNLESSQSMRNYLINVGSYFDMIWENQSIEETNTEHIHLKWEEEENVEIYDFMVHESGASKVILVISTDGYAYVNSTTLQKEDSNLYFMKRIQDFEFFD